MSEELVQRVTFKDVFDTYGTFSSAWDDSGFPRSVISNTNQPLVYSLLYSRYANSTVASIDIDRFKSEVFSIIWQHGPAWQKKLAIQAAINAMDEDDVEIRDTTIFNTAQNPSTAPATSDFTPLSKIDAQNQQQTKRNPLVGWAQLRELIEADFTGQFLDKFKKLFILIVEGSEGIPPVLTIRGNHIYSEEVPADVVKQGDLFVSETKIKQWDDGAWVTIVDFSEIVSETDWGDIGGTLSDQVDLQNALNGKLDKVTSTTTRPQVYTKTGSGIQTMLDVAPNDAAAGSIAQRNSDGQLFVATPTADGHATTKKYVDDADATKLDKDTSVTTYDQAYIKNADGTQGVNNIASTLVANTIAQRYTDGRLVVGAPAGQYDATNKKYVDERVSGTNDGTNWLTITIGGNTYAVTGGGGGSTTWGAIIGTLSNQTDLQTALNGKLDKLTTTTTYSQLYGKTAAGNNAMYNIDDGYNANTIAYRDNAGRLYVGTPTLNNHAATKKYVDDAISGAVAPTYYMHHIRLYSAETYDVTFDVMSTSSTQYDATTLPNLFPSGASRTASGGVKFSTRAYSVVRLTRGSATEFTIYGVGNDSNNSYDEQDNDFAYSGATVTDTVETIS